jgi:fibronectin type 3 domain-containing protein
MKRLITNVLASFKPSPNRPLTQSRRVRLGLENLEGRDLMSASPLAAPAHAMSAAAVGQASAQPVLTLMGNMNSSSTEVDYNIVNFDTFITWPTNPGFYIQIGTEVMKVTAFGKGVNSFIVQRGSNGIETAHSNGDPISLVSAPRVTQPPAAPTNFTAKAVSSSQINLTWSPVGNATSYVIYVWNGKTAQQLDTTTETSYSITKGLQPGATYWFQVAAQNDGGVGSPSNWQSATTPATASLPAAPTSLTASAVSSSQINLYWSAVMGATSYRIYMWNGTSAQSIGTASGTSCGLTGLKAGTAYYFEVAAINAAGTGNPSSWAGATTFTVVEPPAAPGSFTAKASSSSQVNLTWTPSSGGTNYVIQKLVNGAWTTVATVGSGNTTYAVTGLTPATTYQFRVGAENGGGMTYTGTQSALTYPAAPTNFKTQVLSTSELSFTWSPVAGASGYYVEVYYSGAWQMLTNTQNLGITVSGLGYGVSYTFAVGAYNSAGVTFNTFNAAR